MLGLGELVNSKELEEQKEKGKRNDRKRYDRATEEAIMEAVDEQ